MEAKPRKFMFDNDFTPVPRWQREEAERLARQAAHAQQAHVAPEEVAQPAPTFTEDDINLAREAAYEEGRRQGFEEAAVTTERRVQEVLANLATHLDQLDAAQGNANTEALESAVRIGLAVIRKILPATAEANAFTEVVRVIEDVVDQILDEPRIIVRVSEPLVEAVRARLEAVVDSHGFEGRVVVQADGRLALGDCRVEWTDGGAERDQAHIQNEIDAMIERALAPPERRSDTAEPA